MTSASSGKPHGERPGRQPSQRQRYEKPEIVDRGQLAEVALGGTPGTGDSGGGALTEDPP